MSISYHFRLLWESHARRPGPIRPRISPLVRGHGYGQGETGALPPGGPALVEARAKASGSAGVSVCAHSKYSSRIIVGVVGGSVVGVHKSSFFYLRVTPWGGAATKYSNKNVLLCTAVYNQLEHGGRRATAGEQASNKYR